MSNKVFNEEWMNTMLSNKDAPDDRSGSGPQIDWVQYNKGFKRKVMFKLMPANMREDNIFATIVYTHWLKVGDKTYRFVCPEETLHLKKNKCKCPICEAKRKLLSMGFKEEELCEQGKFGPIPLFDPKPTTNIKVVVLSSDTKNWDKSHISVLQQNGIYMATWLADKYKDKTIPNFTDIESSNPIIFSRQSDQGKWDREFSFQQWAPNPDVVSKLKEENEQLTLSDLWKMPSDTDIMQIQQIMDDMINQYVEAKKAMSAPTQLNENVVQEVTLAPTQAVNPNLVYTTTQPVTNVQIPVSQSNGITVQTPMYQPVQNQSQYQYQSQQATEIAKDDFDDIPF